MFFKIGLEDETFQAFKELMQNFQNASLSIFQSKQKFGTIE